MMDRRKTLVVLAASGLFTPLALLAQQPAARTYRIGFLGITSAAAHVTLFDAVRAGLRDLGYVEGRNLVIEARWAEYHYGRLPGLAAELVRLKVEVIVTHSTSGVMAAKQATSSIPIVMANVGGDPVANGLIASLARPGGNVTGSTTLNQDIGAKWLEFLKDAMPGAKRIGLLVNPDNRGSFTEKSIDNAAAKLKLEIQVFEFRGSEALDGTFAAMTKGRVDAVVVMGDRLAVDAAQLAAAAVQRRLLLIGPAVIAQAGGLIGYGPNVQAVYRRSAYFVDKILRGAKPAEIPVEQAARIELIVNLKTAKALGIRIPPALMARADEVIE